MQSEIFLKSFAIFSTIFCLSGGTSAAGGSRKFKIPSRLPGDLYSAQEEMFIIAELKIRGSSYNPSATWAEMAEAHKSKRLSRCAGFNRVRTPLALHQHFFLRMMKKSRPEGAIKVPNAVKQIFRKRQSYYTPQEDAFINSELLSHTGTKLNDYKIWRRISAKHDLKRISRVPGFSAERSRAGLYGHFHRAMIPGGRVSIEVMRKFHLPSPTEPGISRKETTEAKKESISLQSNVVQDRKPTAEVDFVKKEEMDVDDVEEWHAMIHELEESGYEIDFSKM